MKRLLQWAPALMATVALLTSAASGLWCQTIKLEAIDDINPSIQFGPFYRQTTELVEVGLGNSNSPKYVTENKCTPLKDEDNDFDIDTKWRTTRAFSVLSVILGGCVTLLLYVAPCCRLVDDSQWKSVAFLPLVILTTFQGLTFLLLDSNLCTENPFVSSLAYPDECEWDEGMSANVVAVCGWFLTGVLMLWLGAPQGPPQRPAETQTVTYTQTTNPVDGTTTVAENVVIKGVPVGTGVASDQTDSMEKEGQ